MNCEAGAGFSVPPDGWEWSQPLSNIQLPVDGVGLHVRRGCQRGVGVFKVGMSWIDVAVPGCRASQSTRVRSVE